MNPFDVLAPVYDRILHGTQETQSETVLAAMGTAGGRVLDLASGTGMLTGKVAARNPDVVGVDLSMAMLAQARAKHPHLTFIQADAARLPFADGSFDWVTTIDSVHHFRTPEQVAAEVFRVLRPRGRWLILDFDRRSRWSRLIALGERVLGEPSHFFTSDELVELLQQIGFRASAEPVSRAEYLAVAHR